MPTYEFACPNGHEFEKFYKMSDAPAELPCPQCGASAARQISGGAGLHFKGSGFYLTDYGKNAHRTSGDTPKKAAGEPAASSGGSESSGGADAGGGKEAATPKAAESKPAAAKPAESKSAERKSGESKPSPPKKGE
jgi:putative FmdB family regulatory protein